MSTANSFALENTIIGTFARAMELGQFVVYFQPQCNHATKTLVGAEALIRWKHPEKGIIAPIEFIPVLEKSQQITELDLFVFEECCRFLKSYAAKGLKVPPLACNCSRVEIYAEGYVERLEAIRKRYDIPAKLLRIEITESAAAGENNEAAAAFVDALHACGYEVEMDDFGSGFSSLNVLKDINFDVIKLDMRFLQGEVGGRGGIIVSSIVRMAKWLKMPLITEGIETKEQADYMCSLGCEYIQGYYYAKPMPEEDFEQMLRESELGAVKPQLELIDTLNPGKFWNPQSLETLIFSNYVGGAAIFAFKNGRIEILRVNKKYLQELGMNLSEQDVIGSDPWQSMDETNAQMYLAAIQRAIADGEEEEVETWRSMASTCCGEEQLCIRSTLRVLGRSEEEHLFYCMIRNITAEKTRFASILETEKRFKNASEQANIYYWEYTVATKEMRPCFRCMRDLGLPPVVYNYPEPAIAAGIFPPDYADMYRDWHKQIAAGVKSLEAVIPLTIGRVPFHVRYTTEFDEQGHPVKAYGSATLVVD